MTDSANELTTLLAEWDQENGSGADPLPVLTRIAELMEKETESYLKIDPDPFDNRHPGRTDPTCALGQLLKTLFRNDNFITKLVNNYLLHRENRELNTVAARLLIDIMPGLETSAVFQDTEALVSRLYQWAEHAAEPLRSYATGLLAAAMEIQEMTGNFKENNSHLIPIMLQRLHELSREDLAVIVNGVAGSLTTVDGVADRRPFAHLNGGQPLVDETVTSDARNKKHSPEKFKAFLEPARPKGPIICSLQSPPPSLFHPENSNSSWAEMEPYVIGSHQMYPLTPKMQQRLILQYLTAMGEYQEMLCYVFEHNSLNLILHYISLKENKDVRLAFEALKYLAALLCHKKFAIEFVSVGGLQRLLDVHRPSIAATGVSICLYYLAYSEDALEKICLRQPHVLSELVRYTLWLLECSHESSRCHATMFFSLSFQFRSILELFDAQDGLRKLYNMISTLAILSVDENNASETALSDDQVFSGRQTARQVCLALKRYYETHLSIKAEQLKRSHARNLQDTSLSTSTSILAGNTPMTLFSTLSSSSSSIIPPYKAAKFSPDVVQRNIETLLELLPLRSSWTPVDELHRLSGVTLLLQLVVLACEWNYSGRAETVRSALDVLSICSVVPKTQLAFCEAVPLSETPSMVGISILLGLAEGEIIPDPDVQKAALNVIINCVCSPTTRVGGYVGRVVSGSAKKRIALKSNEDLMNKMWNSVRSNNGIMVLLNLLTVKTPITDADGLRALACKALVGLARSETVKQIIGKLPLFTKGQLQVLMREPVLQDNSHEHVKFCRYARELIERVTGKPLVFDVESSIARTNKMDIVAQTKIIYNEKDLLQLIHQYLQSKGLAEAALILRQEAGLSISKDYGESSRGTVGLCSTASRNHSPSIASSTPCSSPLATSRLISRLGLNSSPLVTSTSSTLTSPVPTPPAPSIPGSSNSSTLAMRFPPHLYSRSHQFGRTSGGANTRTVVTPSVITTNNSCPYSPKPSASTLQKIQMSCGDYQQSPVLKRESLAGAMQQRQSVLATGDSPDVQMPITQFASTALNADTEVTLDSIVTEYLRKQHLLCDNPVIRCPPFSLFAPHRCPDPKFLRRAPINMTARLQRQSTFPRFGGVDGEKMNRKFIYSRFRPFRTYRDDEDNDCFTCCTFSASLDSLIFGTSSGDIQVYNLESGEKEIATRCHGTAVTHCEASRDGKHLLTSSAWRSPLAALWTVGAGNFEMLHPFENDFYVEFSKMSQDRVVGTNDGTATIYDVVTGVSLLTLKDERIANNYVRNQATFNPTDELVLSDGILWDVRGGTPIHKFDKFNANISGVFHPNGLEIVSNSEIWDIRTFHLLHTVPALDQCQITFNHKGDVIYGAIIEEDEENASNENQVKSQFGSSIRTFDATDYSNIATIDIKKTIFGLCTDKSDCYLAIIENQMSRDEFTSDSICRLYEVGRSRVEDDDDDDDDDEEDEDDGNDMDASEDDDDDDDDDDMDESDDYDDGEHNSSSDFFDVGSEDDDDDDDDDDEDEEIVEENEVEDDENEEANVEDDEEVDVDEDDEDDDDDDDENVLFSLNDNSEPASF